MSDELTVLTVSDIHAPFTHPRFREFMADTAQTEQPDEIVLIGDVVDLHALSFHEHDPDGMSPGHEIKAARRQVKEWVKLFPQAKVCIGNHDARTIRLARKAGLPLEAVKDFSEIWDTPGWDWDWEHEVDGVLYKHGTGLSSLNAMLTFAQKRMISTVCGHIHKQGGTLYGASQIGRVFAMTVGCGIDVHSYAMDYGRDFTDKPVLGCGVVRGGVPQFIPMKCGVGEAYER